jgi:predicted DNA-binding ribbon-helix-helix protein
MAGQEDIFCAARKRSITIAGHPTSIRIESLFWDALIAEADSRGLPVSALVAQIDAARLTVDRPPNLASALRLWLYARATAGVGPIPL